MEHQRVKNRLKAQLLDDVRERLIISHPLTKLAVPVALCSGSLMTKLGSIRWPLCLFPATQVQLNLSDVTKDLFLLLMVQDRKGAPLPISTLRLVIARCLGAQVGIAKVKPLMKIMQTVKGRKKTEVNFIQDLPSVLLFLTCWYLLILKGVAHQRLENETY